VILTQKYFPLPLKSEVVPQALWACCPFYFEEFCWCGAQC